MSVVLIGMMGSGKTAVGRAAAKQCGNEFVDLDAVVQEMAGKPTASIFKEGGEQEFRRLETAALASLAEREKIVLACGGGTVIDPSNFNTANDIGPLIYLKVSLPVLLKRLSSNREKRPLLLHDDWREKVESLLETREPVYLKADHVIEADRYPVHVLASKVADIARNTRP